MASTICQVNPGTGPSTETNDYPHLGDGMGLEEPVPPWERPEGPGFFTSRQTAIRIGHYKWLEMKIFELLGGWVAMVPELDVKVTLGTHCHDHALHAELWHKRLPELGELKPELLTVAPHQSVVEVFDWFGQPGEPSSDGCDDTITKLAGLYRVLIPGLVGAYTYHLNRVSRLGDAPTKRILELCLHDDMEHWRQGEMMLQFMTTSSELVHAACSAQLKISTLLLKAEGILGPTTLGTYRLR